VKYKTGTNFFTTNLNPSNFEGGFTVIKQGI
jgi:hypothetical protein